LSGASPTIDVLRARVRTLPRGVVAVCRASGRVIAFALWTIACLALLFAGAPFAARGERSRPGWKARLQRRWSRGVLRILGGRVRVKGAPPATPCLVVSNHTGYVDIAVLGANLDATFVARADLSGWPVFGFLSRTAGTLFVDRGRRRDAARAVSAIRDALGAGRTVVLFPEGTSTDGSGVAPFRSSLLEAAASTGVAVMAAAVAYSGLPDEPDAKAAVAWWDETPLLLHLARLFTLRGFEAYVAFDPNTVIHEDRKILTETLWQRVRSLHHDLAAS